MKKSLPLLAGAIAIPLLMATIATFAAAGGGGEAPVATLPPVSSSSLEAPVQLATTTTTTAPPIRTTLPHGPAEETPMVANADDPEVPTSTAAPTEQPGTVPPNEWKTPEPTSPPLASPIPSGGPVEMAISWDGLKCARSEAWILETEGGKKMMCPGSATP